MDWRYHWVLPIQRRDGRLLLAVDGLLRSKLTGAAGLVQNLSYNWDKVGNLTHREDQNQSLAEDFTMDDLNRLTDSRLTVGSTQTTNLHMVYDASGNITSKSDVGTYLYPTSGVGSVRPHAVSSAGCGFHASRPLIPAHAGPAFHGKPGRG